MNEITKYFNDVIKPFMVQLRMKQKQTQVVPEISKVDHGQLTDMHSIARSYLQECLTKCNALLQKSILLPGTIQEALSLERDIRLEKMQLDLYVLELEKLKTRSPDAHCVAKLVIAKQPFPKPIKKKTPVSGADGEREEPTLVKLLTGSKVCYIPESKVTAEVIAEDSKKGEDAFWAGERALEDGYATFFDLRFDKPTRLNIAHLFFSVRLRFMADEKLGTSLQIRSDPSAPFIVITNESQWGDSEGLLMKIKVFGDQNEVPWEYLCNHIQYHFIRSTRQDSVKPDRPLSLFDLNYLARRSFNDKRMITKDDYDQFWNWFGLVCRRIRHQLPFHSLWMKGLVWGFISRKDSERVMESEPPGTFLIRFSESNPGKIVVSYVKWGPLSEIGHFLLACGPREAPKHLQQILEKKTVRLFFSLFLFSLFSFFFSLHFLFLFFPFFSLHFLLFHFLFFLNLLSNRSTHTFSKLAPISNPKVNF